MRGIGRLGAGQRQDQADCSGVELGPGRKGARRWTLIDESEDYAPRWRAVPEGAPFASEYAECVEVMPVSEHEALARQLLECDEALRCVEGAYAAFREQMLETVKGTEGLGIESMSWDDLLGVAVRNLNTALDEGRRGDRLEVALRDLMSSARPWLESGRTAADPAMAAARAALEQSA
jgi:hypothetical protein